MCNDTGILIPNPHEPSLVSSPLCLYIPPPPRPDPVYHHCHNHIPTCRHADIQHRKFVKRYHNNGKFGPAAAQAKQKQLTKQLQVRPKTNNLMIFSVARKIYTLKYKILHLEMRADTCDTSHRTSPFGFCSCPWQQRRGSRSALFSLALWCMRQGPGRGRALRRRRGWLNVW